MLGLSNGVNVREIRVDSEPERMVRCFGCLKKEKLTAAPYFNERSSLHRLAEHDL